MYDNISNFWMEYEAGAIGCLRLNQFWALVRSIHRSGGPSLETLLGLHLHRIRKENP